MQEPGGLGDGAGTGWEIGGLGASEHNGTPRGVLLEKNNVENKPQRIRKDSVTSLHVPTAPSEKNPFLGATDSHKLGRNQSMFYTFLHVSAINNSSMVLCV